MGLFISLEIDQQRCLGVDRCGKCIKAAPFRSSKKASDVPPRSSKMKMNVHSAICAWRFANLGP